MWTGGILVEIVSVREHPDYKDIAIQYFQDKWASPQTLMVYDDCITHCIGAVNPLPQWYLLEEDGEILGCCGLITNDFISRMDLYPWLCALYIDDAWRGRALGSVLIDRARQDAAKAGFESIYLATDHISYYEKYGFSYMGNGYHPWGDTSRIYRAATAGLTNHQHGSD